jgi:beta-fructofuranosidase
MWECANLLPVGGGRHVLFVSDNPGKWLDRVVKYSVGTWQDEKFEMGEWRYFDWGEREPYAPGGFVDPKGRAIALGYIPARGLASSPPWANCLSLPRVLKLRKDGLLGMEPLPELKELRGKKCKFDAFTLDDESPNILEEVKSNTFEIVVEFENVNAEEFGFELLRSNDRKFSAPVVYSTLTKEFTVGATTGPFMLLGKEKTFQLRIFVDRTVLEMFASGRDVFTSSGVTDNPKNRGMRLFAVGGRTKVRSLELYEMGSIWR